jgi:uncharacterized protein YciI
MMWYVIYARDREDSLARRAQAREAHVARLFALQDEGRLLVAGPRPAIDASEPGPAGFCGSLIIARFESLEAARDWANTDPYVAAGVYDTVEVSPFIRARPK